MYIPNYPDDQNAVTGPDGPDNSNRLLIKDGESIQRPRATQVGGQGYRPEIGWHLTLPPAAGSGREVELPLNVQIAVGDLSFAGVIWLLGISLLLAAASAWHYSRVAGGHPGLPASIRNMLTSYGRRSSAAAAARGAAMILPLVLVGYASIQLYWNYHPPLRASIWSRISLGNASPDWEADFSTSGHTLPLTVFAVDLVNLDDGTRVSAQLSRQSAWQWDVGFLPVTTVAVSRQAPHDRVSLHLDAPAGSRLEGSEWEIHYRILGWPHVLYIPANVHMAPSGP